MRNDFDERRHIEDFGRLLPLAAKAKVEGVYNTLGIEPLGH